jgi:hypothetical protein
MDRSHDELSNKPLQPTSGARRVGGKCDPIECAARG